ncbi:MAG: hypothetical protein AAGJ19_00655 [Myxococcota bacterium]
MGRGLWICLLGASACTNQIDLSPRAESPVSADQGRDLGAEPPDLGPVSDDGGVRPQPRIPAPERLRAWAEALPRNRRLGSDAHREATEAWARALESSGASVMGFPVELVAWNPGPVRMVASTGTTTRSLQAWPSEGSGSAELDLPGLADLDLGDASEGRVALVDVRFDDDLAFRLANHPNVAALSIESFFDVYWTASRAGAAGLIMALPPDAPPGAPSFPGTPELGPRMPAALVGHETGEWLRSVREELRLEWRFDTRTSTLSAQTLFAQVPGPPLAPRVAVVAPLDSPHGNPSFDTGLIAARALVQALASIPLEDRGVRLVLIHPASHWSDPGRALQRYLDEEILGSAAGIDAFVELFAPVGEDRAFGEPAPRVAWRPSENDLLDQWLEAWSGPGLLSLREQLPPSDMLGVERRLDAAPRVVFSAGFDGRYFGPEGTAPFLAEDVHELVTGLVDWLRQAPRPNGRQVSAVQSVVTSTSFRVPIESAWPGRDPIPGTLGLVASLPEPTSTPEAVMLAIEGLDLPASAIYQEGVPTRSWLAHLAEAGVAAYALDISGSGTSLRPSGFDEAKNWQTSAGTRDSQAEDRFTLHDTASIEHEVLAALAFLETRHPGMKVHLTGTGVMGGLALYVARGRSDRIASVTAYGTQGLFIFPASPPRLPAAGRPARVVRRDELRARWSPMVRRLAQVDQASFEDAWTSLSTGDLDVLLQPIATLWGLRAELAAEIDVPVLLAFGGYDNEAPGFLVRPLYDALTQAPRRWMVEVADSSRFAYWEQTRTRLFELHRRWILDGPDANRLEGEGRFDGAAFQWTD